MPIRLQPQLTPAKLRPSLERLFELSARKILSLEQTWDPAQGTPVFTVQGRYTSRGWTEWTQGFQFGSALLQYDATGERAFLDIGRRGTLARMATHLTHTGVHDHGFHTISTYGNLLRLWHEGKLPGLEDERPHYELAIQVSGAVQASRWTRLADGTGFIHSFNGPHSLFVDTIRSCRVLALAHAFGHVLLGEQDARISLLQRLVEHATNTARFSIYYGEGRDAYDNPGRVTHEAVFNVTNGHFRCPNSQQGFSPFTTWTRGLAWAICGFSELLEYFQIQPGLTSETREMFERAAKVTADYYLEHCCTDGIPMWDTGAPNLHRLPANYTRQPADPFNQWEPVDSSAASIAAQGLWRLGTFCAAAGKADPEAMKRAKRYRSAALTIAATLFAEPYLSVNARHQGLILHSVYHRPNGWDYVAPKQHVPNGESSQWGDYHARELALLLLRDARGEKPLRFGPLPTPGQAGT